ncbi:FG-GAP repeat protein [Candidatus Peregrinibacteria bacterium]|nr:MAG: FG-GAP repeat protein [Candidatus Peregrinibacteria bacterium]
MQTKKRLSFFALALSFVLVLPVQAVSLTSTSEGGYAIQEFVGEWTSDLAGASVAAAGDVDGDGYDDFLVGAPQNSDAATNAGATYLVYGPIYQTANETRIPNFPLLGGSSIVAEFSGEAESSYSGSSVAGVGDVNADGYDDFVIGAYAYSSGEETYEGAAYLVYGQSTRYTSVSLSSSSVVRFLGEAESSAGTSVSAAGDVNNDGYEDFLIGAPYYSNTNGWVGATYLVLGRSTRYQDRTLGSANSIKRFVGATTDSLSGTSVAGGDIDADGYSDVIIGAPAGRGAVYVVYGGASIASRSLSATSVYKFVGENTGDNAGDEIAFAGDVNGDGYGEILVGAPLNSDGGLNQTGAVYLVYGTSRQNATRVTSLGSSSIVEIMGVDLQERLGEGDLAGLGDLNGDGYGEILLGSRSVDSSVGTNAGAAYLLYGQSAAFSAMATTDPLFTAFNGELTGDQAGSSVSFGGTLINNDLCFIVGALANDDSGYSNAGAAYVIWAE